MSQNLLVTAYVDTDDIEETIKNLENNFNWAKFEDQGFNMVEFDYEKVPDEELEDFIYSPNLEEFIQNSY